MLSKIIKKGEKFGNVEAAVADANEATLVYDNNSIKNMVEGSQAILAIRVSDGRRFGYSTTSNLEKWEKCLNSAVKIMHVSRPLKEEFEIARKSKFQNSKGIYSKEIEKLSAEKLVSIGDKMVHTALGLNKKLLVPNASISKLTSNYQFMNSNGINVRWKNTIFSASLQAVSGISSGSESRISHQLVDEKAVGKIAAQMCIDGLNPKPVKTEKVDLILDYFAFSSLIMSILVPSLQGNNVLSRKSYLQDKLGKKVFSEKLSVVDDGILPNGLFSSAADAEGVARQKTILIENGVVKNFLYDLYSAKLAKMKSTGNCMSLEKMPNVGPSNFIVCKGDYKKDEMIKDTKEGIYTYFLAGAHVVNETTGDVSVGIENAFYVKNGSIEHPVRQALVSFNLFEALKNVQVIGKDIRQEAEVACPIVKFSNVQVIS
jgi:PmbA protein